MISSPEGQAEASGTFPSEKSLETSLGRPLPWALPLGGGHFLCKGRTAALGAPLLGHPYSVGGILEDLEGGERSGACGLGNFEPSLAHHCLWPHSFPCARMRPLPFCSHGPHPLCPDSHGPSSCRRRARSGCRGCRSISLPGQRQRGFKSVAPFTDLLLTRPFLQVSYLGS